MYVEALTPSVAVFGDGTFKEVIKIDEVIRVGPDPVGRVSLQEKEETPELSPYMCTEERPQRT